MTTAPTPTQLMAGFKSGFKEIIDLVTEANDKTGPWVTDRIQKMSKKAQDEIYGRFNEAFNGGLKDAAAGREFYESSLDFPALAQKTTQVADDIELADQINKLFLRNAPVLEHYKKLSESARKEIEKHLKTTADKAKPKELQNALLTVFGGMGRLADEKTIKAPAPSSSSSSSSSAKPAPNAEPAKVERVELTDDIVNRIVDLAYDYKMDLDFLKLAKNKYSDRKNLFENLSPYAQLLIELRDETGSPGYGGLTGYGSIVSKCTSDPDAIREVFLDLLNLFELNESEEDICTTQVIKLGSTELKLLFQYLCYPRHLAHEYVKKHPNCSYSDLAPYVRTKAREITPMSSGMASDFQNLDRLIVEEITQAEKDMSASLDFETYAKLVKDLNSRTFNREEFVAFCTSGNYSLTLRQLLKDLLHEKWKVTPETATIHQIKEACDLVLPELKKNWLLHNRKYNEHRTTFFGNDKFLDAVYASLPTPKAEPVKPDPLANYGVKFKNGLLKVGEENKELFEKLKIIIDQDTPAKKINELYRQLPDNIRKELQDSLDKYCRGVRFVDALRDDIECAGHHCIRRLVREHAEKQEKKAN